MGTSYCQYNLYVLGPNRFRLASTVHAGKRYIHWRIVSSAAFDREYYACLYRNDA